MGTVNVRLPNKLDAFLKQVTGPDGMYESASEYVRDLIRRDYDRLEEHNWKWLRQELEPGMSADETAFNEVNADDVIKRNRKNHKRS